MSKFMSVITESLSTMGALFLSVCVFRIVDYRLRFTSGIRVMAQVQFPRVALTMQYWGRIIG